MDGVEDDDIVDVGVEEADGDPVPVPVNVGVADSLAVDVIDALPESEPVLDALAPAVNDDVGDLVMDRERDCVDDGVPLGVGEAEPVPDDVGVTLSESVGEAEEVPEILGVADALAPSVKEAV